jgi:RNA polymerase sigma-70 factor (ECF subfamily)
MHEGQDGEHESMSTLEYQQVHEAATIRARSHPTRPSPQDVEDIAQETVARFAKQEPGSIENPAAWANTVAGNLCVNLARSQRGARPQMDDDDPGALNRFLLGRSSSWGAIVREQAGVLLAMLNPRERELIQLVAEDTPQSEIAEIMGYANADSVKVTLNRIRKKIKDGADAAGLDTRWELHSRPY